jgi:glycosyltransferase involved in cell wall biosynthesis
MISVVLANYNGARWLATSIESVLRQEDRNFELIVVDDGSTDHSAEILRKCAAQSEGRLRPIFCRENRGQGIAFNVGIEAAQGEIVSFLDADDLWFPLKLTRVRQTFQQVEDVALFQHNLRILREDRDTNETQTCQLLSGDLMEWSRRSGMLPPFAPSSGLSIRRDVLERVLPIPADFISCADGFLTRTSMCFGLVESTVECLGCYRQHAANNVLERPDFSVPRYLEEMLYPALNRFYSHNEIDLCYGRSSRSVYRRAADLSLRSLYNRVLYMVDRRRAA